MLIYFVSQHPTQHPTPNAQHPTTAQDAEQNSKKQSIEPVRAPWHPCTAKRLVPHFCFGHLMHSASRALHLCVHTLTHTNAPAPASKSVRINCALQTGAQLCAVSSCHGRAFLKRTSCLLSLNRTEAPASNPPCIDACVYPGCVASQIRCR